MLILPIKGKWLDMIRRGEKKEEYREITPYYISRFANLWAKQNGNDEYSEERKRIPAEERYRDFVQFCRKCNVVLWDVGLRAGYSRNSPTIKTWVVVHIGTGKQEWGAEPGKEYFVLHIGEMEDITE